MVTLFPSKYSWYYNTKIKSGTNIEGGKEGKRVGGKGKRDKMKKKGKEDLNFNLNN